MSDLESFSKAPKRLKDETGVSRSEEVARQTFFETCRQVCPVDNVQSMEDFTNILILSRVSDVLNILELMKQGNKIVVLSGNSGIGKTTTAKLALRIARSQGCKCKQFYGQDLSRSKEDLAPAERAPFDDNVILQRYFPIKGIPPEDAPEMRVLDEMMGMKIGENSYSNLIHICQGKNSVIGTMLSEAFEGYEQLFIDLKEKHNIPFVVYDIQQKEIPSDYMKVFCASFGINTEVTKFLMETSLIRDPQFFYWKFFDKFLREKFPEKNYADVSLSDIKEYFCPNGIVSMSEKGMSFWIDTYTEWTIEFLGNLGFCYNERLRTSIPDIKSSMEESRQELINNFRREYVLNPI